MKHTYADVELLYSWGTLFPLPANAKTPPPKNVIGRDAPPVSEERREKWAGRAGNFGLRLDEDVVGIDVDQYDYLDPSRGPVHKYGMRTLRAVEAQLGELPPTWVSTGRNYEEGSGIRLFRLPAGYEGTVNRQGCGDYVDVIRYDHRFAVVWPSVVNDDRGERSYMWFTPDGEPTTCPPSKDDLAELPEAWAEWLCDPEHGTFHDDLSTLDLEGLSEDDVDEEYARQRCAEIIKHLEDELQEALLLDEGQVTEKGNGWEKVVANTAYYLHRLAITPKSGYDRASAEQLFYDMVPQPMQVTDSYTATRKWEGQEDAAVLKGGPFNVLTEAQMAAREFAKLPPEPSVQGEGETPTEPFKGEPLPKFNPDVLDPIDLVKAAITASRDLVFVAEQQCWYTRSDTTNTWARFAGTASQGARIMLARLSDTMPRGRRDSDDPVLKAQALRYAMMASPARRGSTAAVVIDQLPTNTTMSLLETDPEHLWAGGWCWDLRASREKPTLAAGVNTYKPHLYTAAVMPVPGPTPRFDALLEAMFPDAEMRDYVWHLFGASLLGYSDRMLCVIYGDTGVGKTTVMNLMTMVLGEYAQPMSSKLLDPQRCTEFDRMDLLGVRLASVDEGPRDNRSGQEHLKDLTGGGMVRGAVKGKPSVSFKPTHTLWFTDNREPSVSDPAVRDRVRAIPVEVTKKDVDPAAGAILKDRNGWLREEGPAVLARMMSMAAEYLADSSVCDMPDRLSAQMETLGEEQDPVTAWLKECAEKVEDRSDDTTSTELYQHFRMYAQGQGVARSLIPNAIQFGLALKKHGAVKRLSHGKKLYNLKVRDDAWEV